ncbi:hypothetical protein FACS1894204_10310 [Synergistales bacterium]|nr:hypothetical protein FACS1894204_10310 [Synergistales bacterium]
MDAKLQILQNTFQKRFSVENFLRFSTEFFGNLKVVAPDKDISVETLIEYRYTVDSYRHIASYSSANNTVDVFAVKLQKGRTVERARSMQRSFVSKLLTASNHDAAIVAFYTDDDPRWRLSFIRLDYEFAAGRVKMSLTPAKRYSYLVGEKEPCHTAMEQLYPIFLDEDFNPTLDKIEEAFSVERVTKDFFEQYKEKYFALKEHLDSSEIFNGEAQRCGFVSEQFAKKLMGQLAFLYFLQKKGWLGVRVLPHTLTEKMYKDAFYKTKASREIIPKIYQSSSADEYKLVYSALLSLSEDDANIAAGCFKTDEWGSGEKAFVRHLFTSCKGNFFDDFLEPLFYEALNQQRGKNNFYKRFNCKIPFLNGGLFEPLRNYDWRHIKFAIPNELFSNVGTKGERDADGILDIFDRYNFTMNEDEPLEREVAVDPEMLGKIFENLLDASDRKSKGAFYTPREIVHYMCAESLVNYLVGKTGVPYDDMKSFIVDGEFMKDEDYNNRGQRKLPQSVYDNLRAIDKALETIKVADPAVGSGAFPLGMLSEIVKARNNITSYYAAQLQKAEERARIFEQREPYLLKWQTIQNCIFAVDIEASAVDIAKLRLWLSLVVDEDLTPTYDEKRYGDARQKDPRPLPNLDYNIMCGNSLVDEFEGIQLFDYTLLGKNENNVSKTQEGLQLDLFSDSMTIYLDDLRKEQERLFGEQNTESKREIKRHIDSIIDNIIRAKLVRDNNDAGLRKYEESLKQHTKPYFLWKLEFARVFRENGGFDVVIGNPPYFIFQKDHTQDIDEIKRQKYANFIGSGKINAYRAFIAKSLDSLIVSHGIMCMIFQNSFLGDSSVGKLRKYIFDNHNIIRIDSFPERDNVAKRVFENVKMSVCIMLLEAKTHNASFELNMYSDKHFTKSYTNTIYYRDIEKMDSKNHTIPMLNPSELSVILRTFEYGQLELKTIEGEINMTFHKHLLSENSTNPETLKGAAIQRFRVTEKMSQGKREFLNVELYNSKNSGEKTKHFQYPRIAMQGITGVDDKRRLIMTLVPAGFYLANSCNYILRPDNIQLESLLGILNSTLLNWIFKKTSTNSNVNCYEVNKLPIPIVSQEHSNHITRLVTQILSEKRADPSADTSALEAEIDCLVYELYGLTDDEIKIVEGVV